MLEGNNNNELWETYRGKVCIDPSESIVNFARRVYTSTDPVNLAELFTTYVLASSKNEHSYDLVEQLVIANPKYLKTLGGLRCLMLISKSYFDLGLPKKAWLLNRRGSAIMDLMVCVFNNFMLPSLSTAITTTYSLMVGSDQRPKWLIIDETVRRRSNITTGYIFESQ